MKRERQSPTGAADIAALQRQAKCKSDPGVIRPVVDASRCEGKGDCVMVCPYDVFVVGQLSDAAFRSMPLMTKLKLWAHGRRTAFAPNADACRACGLCVTVCPEDAIRLAPFGGGASSSPVP